MRVKLPIKIRINYLLIPLFVIITASAASHFADTGLAWYKTINLPGWTFSNLFKLNIWIFIFAFTALSILIIWNRYSKERNFSLIIALFVLNAVINVGWSILFYTQQQLGLALFESVSASVYYFSTDWSYLAFLSACSLYASSLFGLGDLYNCSNIECLDDELVLYNLKT